MSFVDEIEGTAALIHRVAWWVRQEHGSESEVAMFVAGRELSHQATRLETLAKALRHPDVGGAAADNVVPFRPRRTAAGHGGGGNAA